MGSLQCAVNITNDQFKLALAAFLKEAKRSLPRGPLGWAVTKKVPVQPPRGQMLVRVRLHVIPCDNVG